MFSKEKIKNDIQLDVVAGKGGSGCMSFASSRHKSRGGPDGGDGGRGGHIYLKVSSHRNSLSHLKKIYKAGNGKPGSSRRKTGQRGKDLYIDVPLNTWIKTKNHNMLLSPDKSFLLVKGGRGGRGNHFFKNSTNQAPTKIGRGQEGQTLEIHLKLN